jgi:hypothetical protein
MILLDWFPEFILLFQLFVVLICLNFKILSERSLSLWIGIFSFTAMIYYGARVDLESFVSPVRMLHTDSLAHFGRLVSFLILIVGSFSIHFHHEITFAAKQKLALFLMFFCIFLNTAFLSNSIWLFIMAWLGVYFSVQNIVLIESNLSRQWTLYFSKHSSSVAVLLALFLCLMLMTVMPTGSIYFSDYLEWIKAEGAQNVQVIRATGVVIMMLGALMSHRFVLPGKGPFGVAVSNLSLFILVALYWIRIGIPFLNETSIIPHVPAQLFLGTIFGVFSIVYAVKSLRTLQHDRWISAVFPSLIGMGWMALLLPSAQSQPVFYVLVISFCVTFFLVSNAFLERSHPNRILILSSIFALVGAPPFILGEQFFKILRISVESNLIPIAVGVATSWFILCVSGFQMSNKIILAKRVRTAVPTARRQEFLLLGIYCMSVIALTAFRPALISFLNAHPALHLW